jgi:AraC family transcriptional regulator
MDNLFLRIENLPEKKLLGKRLRMSLVNDQTMQLWQSFMPRRKEIQDTIGKELYCVQIYDKDLQFENFTPTTLFDKWAAIEVKDFNHIPEDMETHILRGGLYAVFLHKGIPSAFQPTFEFIYHHWLPNSSYLLDKRDHFDLLGEKYKNNDPSSEEEIWVPIKPKK